MTIFSRQHRSDTGGYRQREPKFEYLDRSARPEAAAIRRRITRWVRDYPAAQRDEWVARFTSGDDVAYSSAFFELYLFTYFTRAGFKVDVTPDSQGGTIRAPDFRVTRQDIGFYLEATTAHDESATERRVTTWKATVRARIDMIVNDFFFVSLEWPRDPTAQPAPARAAQHVEQWLATLDHASLLPRYQTVKRFTFPTLTLNVGGGVLNVLAVPKNRPRQTQGLLGSETFGLRQVNVLATVRGALRKKSSRYGALTLPYIVAINVHANSAEDDEFTDALFGTPEVVVRADGTHRWRYGSDGGFGHQSNPRAQGVSAVLCVRDITPWTIGQEHEHRRMYVFHHPHARRPLPVGTVGLAERWVENGTFKSSAGRYARGVLGIPKDWPDTVL